MDNDIVCCCNLWWWLSTVLPLPKLRSTKFLLHCNCRPNSWTPHFTIKYSSKFWGWRSRRRSLFPGYWDQWRQWTILRKCWAITTKTNSRQRDPKKKSWANKLNKNIRSSTAIFANLSAGPFVLVIGVWLITSQRRDDTVCVETN